MSAVGVPRPTYDGVGGRMRPFGRNGPERLNGVVFRSVRFRAHDGEGCRLVGAEIFLHTSTILLASRKYLSDTLSSWG
jgi:hypothetical protein